MVSARKVFTSAASAIFFSALAFGIGAPVFAQDLSDDATCLECHADTERAPPSNPDRPQVHNPAGGYFVEDHEMWSCTDCHAYIVDLEHEDSAPGNEVDCTNCHDQDPTK
jgi:hypothetical protein